MFLMFFLGVFKMCLFLLKCFFFKVLDVFGYILFVFPKVFDVS